MDRWRLAEALLRSERALGARGGEAGAPVRKQEAEGGCGVVGVAASVPVPGRALLQALGQMRNRGNGKGGGIAAVGLDPAFFGVSPTELRDDYLLAIAYLDSAARPEVEAAFIEPVFVVDQVVDLPAHWEVERLGLEVAPPRVTCYFVRVRPDARAAFLAANQLPAAHAAAAEDELVYQNTFRLNRAFYASTGEKRAFVLSHGRNLLVCKLVGYGDDVLRAYGLTDLAAHVWIGHHRYPTKGRVWHPGGAHPFIGLHEALVHNGDFANYSSLCASLAQQGRQPLFLTDTEVAALVFDLLHRVYGYPLEAVIEVLAPTTERDFALLPEPRQRLYGALQATHIHLSPDGPWYFLIAQSAAREGVARLIGITDTSMLRPQVFALQRGPASVGLAASEKQAIDAVLDGLARERAGSWSRADLYWSARGGSHTDGGAFVFNVGLDAAPPRVWCTDKFGRLIDVDDRSSAVPDTRAADDRSATPGAADAPTLVASDRPARELASEMTRRLPTWGYAGLESFLRALRASAADDDGRQRAIAVLADLMDRPYGLAPLRRSYVLARCDQCLGEIAQAIRQRPSGRFLWAGSLPPHGIIDAGSDAAVVLDGRDLPPDGPASLSRRLVELHERGIGRFLVVNARGHRFIGCGLGPPSKDVQIDVFGSSGDYLASGIDGAQIVVHGSAQDQVGQILKDGTLVVHGDVGQTFMYGAKGGDVFVRGNAAGRPLINAVGRPRVVINGTCLDYLGESFMAGDPLNGGGFVVLNGVAVDAEGALHELDAPYPGGNLFSLASGGAIYVRDPHDRVGEDQLNGGELVGLTDRDWELIRPYLERNELLFDIPLHWLLTVDGRTAQPDQVYRKIQPAGHRVLSAEEDWVRHGA